MDDIYLCMSLLIDDGGDFGRIMVTEVGGVKSDPP